MLLLRAFAVLLGCQWAGEMLSRMFALPIPGAVIGCVLLLAALSAGAGLPDDLRSVVGALLRHLPVLFVPAGVGAVAYADVLREAWLPLLCVLVASTVITFAVSVAAFGAVSRALSRRHGPEAGID